VASPRCITLAVCTTSTWREVHGRRGGATASRSRRWVPSIEEITFRFSKNLEWTSRAFVREIHVDDVAGKRPMVPIPVFHHASTAIPQSTCAATGINAKTWKAAPSDSRMAQTAGIYVRGFLAEDYGIDLTSIRWLQAGVDDPGT